MEVFDADRQVVFVAYILGRQAVEVIILFRPFVLKHLVAPCLLDIARLVQAGLERGYSVFRRKGLVLVDARTAYALGFQGFWAEQGFWA